MANKKHTLTSIVAKPPVDTNKPKYDKVIESVSYQFYDTYGVLRAVDHTGNSVVVDLSVDVKDIPTLIAVLQDIYSGANV